jgi:general stress protein 26
LGTTQTKKSTIAAIMLSFYGKFTASTLPASFKDTGNAIEKKGHILKDVLIVIDDFHPVTHYGDRQNMEKIAQALSRSYGDRSGKDRMQADTAIRQGYKPRGNAIITGEDFPAIGQSGSARNFIIELLPNDIPASDNLDFVQEKASQGFLAAFMSQYIEWLIPQSDDLPAILKEKFLELRHKTIGEAFAGLGRAGDIISWLQIGMETFIDFMIFKNALSQKDGDVMKQESWNIFCGLSDVQIEKSEEDKPSNMFISALKELLETEKVYLLSYPECKTVTQNAKSEMVGYMEDDKLYFIPNNTYNAVEHFYNQQNISLPLSKTCLFKQMAIENLIEIDSASKSYSKQKRFGKIKNRYLVMRKDVIYG